MPQAKSIVIIAGEESGDQHAAHLVRQLKIKHPDLHFSGIGGKHLENEGVVLLSDLARYGVTGIIEVFRHLKVIRQAFKRIQAYLKNHQPDLLILVDYPGFNLRLAKFAKQQLQIPILYYISPQLWAWKQGRIHAIKAYVDHMAVILPFEKKYYENANVEAFFVGHPLLPRLAEIEKNRLDKNALKLPENKKIIALLPGSRRNEIDYHMPIFSAAAKKIIQQEPDLHFVIPIAATLDEAKVRAFWPSDVPCTFVKGEVLSIAICSDVVIVASGTASLECALLNKPMCIVYKVSYLTYIAAMHLIRIKYIGLCNLLMNQMVVPELLQYDFNAHELSKMMRLLLNDQNTKLQMKLKLEHLKETLSPEKADIALDHLVEKILNL